MGTSMNFSTRPVVRSSTRVLGYFLIPSWSVIIVMHELMCLIGVSAGKVKVKRRTIDAENEGTTIKTVQLMKRKNSRNEANQFIREAPVIPKEVVNW